MRNAYFPAKAEVSLWNWFANFHSSEIGGFFKLYKRRYVPHWSNKDFKVYHCESAFASWNGRFLEIIMTELLSRP